MHENVDVRLFLHYPIFHLLFVCSNYVVCPYSLVCFCFLSSKMWLKKIIIYIFHNNQTMVYAANSDEPVEGRYFVKAVVVLLFPSKKSIYYTDVEAISDAGQVRNNDILAKHSSCRCWHCTC